MRTRHLFVSILGLCVLITGCAQPPADQINAAEQAVKDAQQTGAATYVANDYAKVEGLLEVAEQDAKFALLRDYGKAEQLAATTKAEAERIKADAAKKMEESKFAAVQAQQAAQAAVASTLALVAKAPVGKDRAAIQSIKTDAEALKASLNDVQMMLDKADYLGAQTKGKAIQDKAESVSHEIETALAKIGKGKPIAKRR
jgi:chemotaxis protein histidine kinase CheA